METSRETTDYSGAEIALLTRHGKQRVISPVLETAFGCRVIHVDGFDTDTLGTFTRERPRLGTQLETARKKARIGMELSGLSLGLASEGAFGADPISGFLPWNVELIVFLDAERELEVVGTAQGSACFSHLSSDQWETVEAFARQTGFPQQQLVMRPQDEQHPALRKDIASWQRLKESFSWAINQSNNDQVFVETDGRAHANPKRMAMIARAAENLVQRLSSLCPVCNTPGYWITDRIAGLPCEWCNQPTRETSADVYQCQTCHQREVRPRTDRTYADPGRCDYCNP